MGFYDDVNDAMGRDTGLRTIANIGRQAMGDTSYRTRMQPDIPEADVAAYKNMRGLPTQPTAAQAPQPPQVSTERPDDITGAAARIQAANPRSVTSVPQMARTLAQESQQRFAAPQGVEGSIGVDGYMRQLQNIRALSDMTPQGGYAVLGGEGPTWQERHNAEMTAKWAQEDRDRQFKSALGGSGADARARMGALASYSNAQTAADTQRHNAELSFQGGRERDASAERIAGSRDLAQFGLEGMRGRNQLAAEDMRRQTALGLEDRRAGSARELEAMRRAGRLDEIGAQAYNAYGLQEDRLEAERPYREAQAKYYGALGQNMEADAAFNKSAAGIRQKAMDSVLKNGGSLTEAKIEAERQVLMAERAARAARGGVNGLADGGQVSDPSVDRAQQLLDAMNAKYGKAPTTNTAPAPQAPPPAQAPAPAPQPQGIADRFRGYFGAPDARMKQNGLAFGGAVLGGAAVAQAVAGRQVFGESDGSGRDDALPAVIDGKHPAALTSGEFVWPVNAVKYFGMAKLNKMLAEAEKGMAPSEDRA